MTVRGAFSPKIQKNPAFFGSHTAAGGPVGAVLPRPAQVWERNGHL
nr:MAG TPA: hypothetical protein [Caudoviricetes sp.]